MAPGWSGARPVTTPRRAARRGGGSRSSPSAPERQATMSAGLVEATAPSDVATAVARLTAALDDRGITVFATIDHAAGARAVGLELADEVVVVFGSPAGGTPVMQ